MKIADLKAVKTKKIDFVNTVKNGTKLELNHKYSYNVGYSQNNICEGEFLAEIKAKGYEDTFHIIVTVVGIFQFKPGTTKETIHIETYNELFPYVRSLVTTLTSNSGIPPIIPPFIDISDKNIYRFDVNGLNKQHDEFINPYDENNNNNNNDTDK